MACEAFADGTGSVVIHDHAKAIARVTPLSDVIDVAPLRGPFAGHVTGVPPAASTHIPNAALNH